MHHVIIIHFIIFKTKEVILIQILYSHSNNHNSNNCKLMNIHRAMKPTIPYNTLFHGEKTIQKLNIIKHCQLKCIFLKFSIFCGIEKFLTNVCLMLNFFPGLKLRSSIASAFTFHCPFDIHVHSNQFFQNIQKQACTSHSIKKKKKTFCRERLWKQTSKIMQ